jgi:hypothetical protein
VKAERDTGGEVDPGDGLAREILRREDYQVSGTAVWIVQEGQHVTVVLRGIGRGWREHGLARRGVRREPVFLHGAVRQVVLEQGVGERLIREIALERDGGPADLSDDRAVAVAVPAASMTTCCTWSQAQ